MTEKEIIQRLKDGDLTALKELWDANSSHVLNLAFRMLLDRDKAEDILMDIFVAIPESIKGFRGESALSTWLYSMTRNACLMKLRKERVHLSIETFNRTEIEECSAGHRHEKVDDALDNESLSHGLSVLSPETRSLLWLKDAEGLELKVLKDIFNAPEGTLKARLFRARAQVRQVLKRESRYA